MVCVSRVGWDVVECLWVFVFVCMYAPVYTVVGLLSRLVHCSSYCSVWCAEVSRLVYGMVVYVCIVYGGDFLFAGEGLP